MNKILKGALDNLRRGFYLSLPSIAIVICIIVFFTISTFVCINFINGNYLEGTFLFLLELCLLFILIGWVYSND